MSTDTARLRTKTWVCATIVVSSNVAGNFFMKRGLPAQISTPFEYITALFQPWVTLGVMLLILWTLSRMALLSWADLSYVLPVTSVGYVLVPLAGTIFLKEQITVQRWAGIVLIMAGVALVSGGAPGKTLAGRQGALRRSGPASESMQHGNAVLPETSRNPAQ